MRRIVGTCPCGRPGVGVGGAFQGGAFRGGMFQGGMFQGGMFQGGGKPRPYISNRKVSDD